MDHWLEAHDWLYGLDLLSLDFINPLYEALGIGVRHRETLKGMARDTRAGRHTELPVPREVQSPNDYLIFFSAQVLPFFDMLERALGVKDKQRVQHWVRYVACTDDHNPWMLYEDALRGWAAILRKTGEDQIGFVADAESIAARLSDEMKIDDVDQILSRQRRSLLTDWDFPFFVKGGLLEIPGDSDFFPFVDGLHLAVEMNRFQRFWQWLISFIGSGDLQSISRFAAAQAEDRHRSPYSTYIAPEELPLPINDEIEPKRITS